MARLSLAFLYGLIEAQNQRIAPLEKTFEPLAQRHDALIESTQARITALEQTRPETTPAPKTESGWTRGARPSQPAPVRNEVPEYVLQRRKAMEAAKAAAMSGQKTVRV